jgi:uncharacterized membrane protein YhaH (DUF805 family)
MTTLLYDLFFSFGGRITRKSWWLGFVVLTVAGLAGSYVLDPQAYQFNIDVRTPSWPDTIWQLALVIPGTAITVKRFNDRNWPNWLGYLYAVAGVGLTLASHYGLLDKSEPGTSEILVILGSVVFLLFAFVDNGFMRGTKGPNRYGPDPLGTNEAA